MADIVIAVVAKIAEYSVAPIASPFINLWKYKNNIENLKKEVEKLEARIDSVQRLIKAGEEPLPHVKIWQDRANSIINEISGLISEDNNPEQQNIQCCKGFTCSNLMKRYKRSKTAAGKLKDVVGLEQQAVQFKEVSCSTIQEETWLQTSEEGYKAFESRTCILKNIIDALSKSDVNVVGIYGMGGIGKTTLAKQVARRAKQDKLFDEIIFVEVSKTAEIKSIQEEIGDKLGLKFDKKTDSGRARTLYQQLKKEVTGSGKADKEEEETVAGSIDNSEEEKKEKKEKKILLILDNIWERIELETVGIPLGNDCGGLKLLLTTRSHHVLTNEMDSQCNFSINTLNEADAWSLFKSIAGTCIEQTHLKSIAPQVAKECGGMPVAIVTIARALRNKEEYVWRNALGELRNPSSTRYGEIAKEVYTSIKLSYDYLETEELKKIFLLCSRMGCTYDASIQDLFRYGFGLGLFDRFDNMEEALCSVYTLVSQLKATSLLLDAPKSGAFSYHGFAPNNERFAMHDVVCDVARSIASRGQNVFNVVDVNIPRYWTNGDILKSCTSITLHNISELPNDLHLVCPQLEFLYVKPKEYLLKISDDFFTGMLGLQVLHLIEMDLSPLPTSLGLLEKLKSMCLEDCELDDIAIIGELKNLQILSFQGSTMEKLPEEMRQVTKLRLLDMTDCYNLSVIPPKVLSSFKNLETLHMKDVDINWEAEKSNNGRRNACLDELEHLSDLTSLEIKFPDASESRNLLSPKLERYNIILGTEPNSKTMMPGWNIPSQTSRCLQVKLSTNEDGVISRLRGIRQLLFDEVPGVANILHDLDRMGFPELEHLTVQNNSHIVHIVDTASHVINAFPILKSLILSNLVNLKAICNGDQLGAESFHHLRTLKVMKCNKLINIFSFAADRIFQVLQELRVYDCENMEEIFAFEGQNDAKNSQAVHEIKFSQLRILTLISVPQLKSLCCNVKTANRMLQLTSDTMAGEITSEEKHDIPGSLFNEEVGFPNLETLDIGKINVKMIWGNQHSTLSCVQNLTYLIIKDLAHLRRLCCENYAEFPSLKEIMIHNCPNLKEFIFDDKVGVPNLEKLNIYKMDNLKKISHNHGCFPKLKSLHVTECQKLLTLFPLDMCESFSSLETLYVSTCDSLEELFDLHGIHSEERHSTTSTQTREQCNNNSQIIVSFANLQNLKVLVCRSLKNLYSTSIVAKEGVVAKEALAFVRFRFPKLTSLELQQLPELKTFYPGRHTMEWPVLKRLKTYHCGIHDTIEKGKILQPPLSKNEVTRLQTSDVFEIHMEKIWHNLLHSMCYSIQNLTKLVVYDCGNLKELFPSYVVVKEELREKEMRNTILFPKLNYLEMGHLENLTRLCSGCYVEFPSLKEFKITNCPELKAFIFDEMVGVPNLEKLDISKMDNLKMIWHNQLAYDDSFAKLKSLQVQGCKKLMTLFTSNMCGKLLSLETLDVSNCGSLEEIFYLQAEERNSTTSTQSRELCTYNPQIILSFANLQKLKVLACQNLRNLFSASTVAKEGVAAKEAFAFARFHFPKLTCLELCNLPELRTFYPGRHTTEWPTIKMLTLYHCGIHDTNEKSKMKQQPFLQNKVLPFSALQKLDVLEIYVEKIWHNLLLAMCSRIQNLTKLVVYDCGDFKELFPSFMVAMEELKEKEMGNTIMFPKLKYLEVKHLANLTKLCSGYYIEFPSLKEFKIIDCPELKTFIFDDMVGVPNLEKIIIFNMDNLKMIWNNQLVCDDSFPKLKSLQVQKCQKLLDLFPSNMCGRFLSLETLDVDKCDSLEEIFDLQGIYSQERHSTTSTQSKELCADNPQIILSFANLQNLKVSACQSLKNLFSASIVGKEVVKEAPGTARFFFPKLTFLGLHQLPELRTFYLGRHTMEWPALKMLKLYHCGIHDTNDQKSKMKQQPFLQNQVVFTRLQTLDVFEIHVEKICNILLPVMSSSIQNLTKLVVYDCGGLKELFPSSLAVMEKLKEKEMGNTILLPKLNYLEMKHLENLTRLCSGYYVEFPSLKEFKITNCPELKAFIFDDKVGVSKLEKMNIFNMDNLKMIWHNQLVYDDSFPKLKSLQVQKCQKLLDLFPSNMCRRFLSLETVDVDKCDSLEKIFDLQEIYSEERHSLTSTQSKELCAYNPQIILSFANLQNLKVSACQNLKNLFSASIVAKEVVKEAPGTARFCFPKLTSLGLHQLPELRTFYPGRHTMEWPALKMLKLYHCGIHDTNVKSKVNQQAILQNQIAFTRLQPKDAFEIHVEKIRHNLFPVVCSSIQNLTKLVICDCGNLKELFPSSMVVTEELRRKEIGNTISFPKLNHLEMKDLVNLTRLSSGYYVEFPSLKEFKITNCPELKAFIFDNTVGLPNLEKINIFKMDNLKMIWHKPHNQLVHVDSFPQLKSLQVHGCQKLLTLFPLNMCGRILSLEIVAVSECDSLEEIFDLKFEERYSTIPTQSREWCTYNPQMIISFANLRELKVSVCQNLKNLFAASIIAEEGVVTKEVPAAARFQFPKLTYLELHKLPELRTFYLGTHTMEWPALKILKMCLCGIHETNEKIIMQKKPFLPNQVAFTYLQNSNVLEIYVEKIWHNLLPVTCSRIQNLTKLVVYDCGHLKELFPSSMVVTKELREKAMGKKILFPKLNYLEVKHLANLTRLCSEYYVEFPSLKEFKISNCSELKAFIFDDMVRVPSLEKMEIVEMDNLKRIWHNQLAYVNSISKLKSLQVSKCGSLEEIFDLHGINFEERHPTTSTQSRELCTHNSQIILSFANLQKMKISACQSLKNLISVSIVAKEEIVGKEMLPRFHFPKLTSLHLHKLPELRTFYPGRYKVEGPVLKRLQLCDYGIHDTNEQSQMQQLFFLVEEAFPCLEELTLAGKEFKMMWQGQDPECVFQKFKILEVLDDQFEDFSLPVQIQRLSKEKFSYREKQTQATTPAKKKVLHYFPNQNDMWKDKLDLMFPYFEDITVRGCDSFISLMPPSVSFQNLTSLGVYHCHCLENIVTSSMAKTLVKLTKMSIFDCKKITEVVGNQRDAAEDKIIFNNLKSLSLKSLPSLISFCSWNCTLEFPSLKEFNVSRCPNMKFFSQGDFITPELKKVQINWKTTELFPNLDVNTAIQQVYEQPNQESSADDLTDYSSDDWTDYSSDD